MLRNAMYCCKCRCSAEGCKVVAMFRCIVACVDVVLLMEISYCKFRFSAARGDLLQLEMHCSRCRCSVAGGDVVLRVDV